MERARYAEILRRLAGNDVEFITLLPFYRVGADANWNVILQLGTWRTS